MSLNKEKVNADLKKAFDFFYSLGRNALHFALVGSLLYYAFYTNTPGIQNTSLLGQFLILELSGMTTLVIVVPFFHLLHQIEIRYFTGSYKMVYFLFKYIHPHSKMSLSGIDYDVVCKGYDEVVKRGNNYHIKEKE